MGRLEASWYRPAWFTGLLLPLAWLFCLLVALRRLLYRLGVLPSHRLPVPVIVVGNISVGGTGKTPLVIALVELLRAQGWRPGVISRGYGGQAASWPQRVTADSEPRLIGDEPLLIARRTHAPLAVGPDRIASAQRLLAEEAIDILISDDGLQHYRLQRDVEVAVVDATRGTGNGLCLPAGPLREPRSRLRSVDLVVSNGEGGGAVTMVLEAGTPRAVADAGRERPLQSFRGAKVHAVAGIGNPPRFFAMLEQAGLTITPHPFPDHHAYQPGDLAFGDDAPILMTEKDAVKCAAMDDARLWYIPVTARLPESFPAQLKMLLEK